MPYGTTLREYFKNWYTNSAIGNTAYSIIITRGWAILIFGFCVTLEYGSFYFISYDNDTNNGVIVPKFPEIELFVLITNAKWIFGDKIPSIFN